MDNKDTEKRYMTLDHLNDLEMAHGNLQRVADEMEDMELAEILLGADVAITAVQQELERRFKQATT